MSKEIVAFIKYIHYRLEPFKRSLKKNQLYSQVQINIRELVEEGFNDAQILQRLGIQTRDSNGKFSRRARMHLENQFDFSNKGVAATEWVQACSLKNYEEALEFLRNEFCFPSPGLTNVEDAELLGIYGSVFRGNPRLGVAPIGIRYDYHYLEHTLSATERRMSRKSGEEVRTMSDIDVLFVIRNHRNKDKILKDADKLSRRIFNEFGVFVHLRSNQELPLSEVEYMSFEALDKAGGLTEYVSNKSNSPAGRIMSRTRGGH